MHNDNTHITFGESGITTSEPETLAEWNHKYSGVPYYNADWELLKALAVKENKSFRSIAKEFNIARNTIRKYVNSDGQRNRRPQPVRDEWREKARQIWSYHSTQSAGEPITAKCVFTLLVEKHGYKGSERTIRTLLLEFRESTNGEDRN
ncbi:MAG: hypothetical protein K2Y22_08965 [Candidatus Obscuribacterales bacterium]|nr:hypothetical protein [Candidatus Obscuribacterales bacterium]